MKSFLIAFLAFLCVFLGFYADLGRRRIQNLQSQNAMLENGLQKQIILKNRVLTQKTRKDDKVALKTTYIPPEGSLDIRQNDDNSLKLEIKDKGLAIRPFASAFITPSGAADIAAGARLAYWGRYGLGAAWAAQNGPLLALDRRLDDIPPLQNTSLMLLLGRNSAGLGIAVYL